MAGEPRSQHQGVLVAPFVLCLILLCREKEKTRWVANFRLDLVQISEFFVFYRLLSFEKPACSDSILGIFRLRTSVHVNH